MGNSVRENLHAPSTKVAQELLNAFLVTCEKKRPAITQLVENTCPNVTAGTLSKKVGKDNTKKESDPHRVAFLYRKCQAGSVLPGHTIQNQEGQFKRFSLI
ncbi:hypothetical protein [Sporolactobacillus sp. THM19-2]|uniref:hypothetical protein n=1 Tax=Sporolactobacillus sp. THM19-2 TaxID=2511171 RepID=UPI001020C906|nr:hypothetical protein [Sporolactobacillus sp. THM19-2]RYL87525.1 hypothetical protein EWH91_12925 [Sporolactobacillus sp. THM19-2]